MLAGDTSNRGSRFQRQRHQCAFKLQRVLPVVATRIRGNDRLKICVHNLNLWAQILCRNSIMKDPSQAVETALGRRLRYSEAILFIKTAPAEHLVGIDAMLAGDMSNRGSRFQRQRHQCAFKLQRMLPVVATRIRGNDRLKICVHNLNLWAQILCRNSIMKDPSQAVETALGRRLPNTIKDFRFKDMSKNLIFSEKFIL